MPVKVVNFTAKVWGETETLTMQNYIQRNLTFKYVNNPFSFIEIPNVDEQLLPTLKEMKPEWFSPKEYFDRIDTVLVEAQPKGGRAMTEAEEAYREGYIAALEMMQQEMNLIEEELHG